MIYNFPRILYWNL